MFKAMTCAVLLLCTIFGYRDMGFAMDTEESGGFGLTHPVPWVYEHPEKWNVTSVFSTLEDSTQVSENQEYKELEKELKALMEEMKKLGKEAGEKVQKEVLPQIKREIERLRERLRQWRHDGDESEPTQVETIET